MTLHNVGARDAKTPTSVVVGDGRTEPATVFVDPAAHPRLQPGAWCRNGMLVNANFQHQLAALANQITRYRTKELFASCFSPVANASGRTVATTNRWRWMGHTSPKCDTIIARVLLGTAILTIGTSDPYARLELFNSAGTPLGYGDYHFGVNTLSLNVATAPSNLAVGTIAIDASGFPDTDIYGLFTDVQGARLAAVCVYEISAFSYVANSYLPQNYAIGGPIHDYDRQGVAETAAQLWKRGAAPVFTFSGDGYTSPKTSSLTAVNVIDDTVSTVSTNSPGYVIDLQYCARKNAATVPCMFASYFGTGTANSGSVTLKDSTGATLATLSGSTVGWRSIAVNIPATIAKYDVHMVSTGGDTNFVEAACLYQYQA